MVSRIFRRFVPQLLHMIVLPIFFFAFMLIYRPYNCPDLFGSQLFSVHLTISTFILLLGTILMRLLYYYLPLRLNYTLYAFWCLAEVIFNTFFVTLYVWLLHQDPEPYFEYFFVVFQYLSTILVFPYVIMALSFMVHEFQNHGDPVLSGRKMRFYDNRHNLKIVLAPESFLYISAEENYVAVYYNENNKLKRYVLRCSMKSLDELCQDHGMIRCHRSYYVNPKHVRVLRKDKDGTLSAELEANEIIKIPVSKRYYNKLAETL